MSVESRRPVGVTVLVILVVIQGIVAVITGFSILSARNDSSYLAVHSLTRSQVTISAWLTIGIGVITILVGLGLGTGSRVARFLVGVFTILVLAGDVYVITKYSGGQQAGAIVSAVVAVVVLYLLYVNKRDREFFAAN